jgi:septum formation protein
MFDLKYPLILGSQSPRRRQILAEAGFKFTVYSPDVDEDYPQNLTGAQIPLYLAKKKATKLAQLIEQPSIILTLDTIVWHQNKAINKPTTLTEAKQMLSELKGKSHYVHTGVCIYLNHNFETFYETTEVFFKNLPEYIIDYYVETYKPTDKAGAYGIQEWIGMIAIEKINGSFYNVMGMPIHRIFDELVKFCQ